MKLSIRKILFLWLVVAPVGVKGQQVVLTLDSCRALAIKNNKEVRMTGFQEEAAHWERKSAHTMYFPKVDASGQFLKVNRDIQLLNDDTKNLLNNLGTVASQSVPSLSGFADALNGVGSQVVDAFHTDNRNTLVTDVLLKQPVYMGGKIVAYNKITKFAEQIAHNNHDLKLQDVIVDVDKAYWQLVALQDKKALAESYLRLVCRLDSDVSKMVDQGFATKADELSVRVKVNEAKVSLIQVNNGLSLTQMLLCELCGINMNTDIQAADKEPMPVAKRSSGNDVQTAWDNRKELQSLSLAEQIYRQKVNIARSEFLPKVALMGGWIGNNPSVYNGFQHHFEGTWGFGVTLNIPLITWGDRIYKVRKAKAEANEASWRLQDIREKVELQVTQNNQKVEEARERLKASLSSQDEADENLRHANLGYKAGTIPLSNVIEAQTAWLKAHSECVDSRVDVRIADLYLNKSMGTLNYME